MKTITARLIGDHKTFRKLIRDMNEFNLKTGVGANGQKLLRVVELLKDHLILHSWAEEGYFYPVVRDRLPAKGPIDRTYFKTLDDEHRMIDVQLDRIEAECREGRFSSDWTGRFQKFVADLTAHMDKEENELFPFSEGLLGTAGLEALSDELERNRKSAPVIRIHTRA